MTEEFQYNVCMKKIVSRDGSTIQLQDDGQIWVEHEKGQHISPAYVTNGTCNIFKILGVKSKYDKYFGVDEKILKYAKKFGIKQLRMGFHEVKATKVGDKLIVKYGYIKRSSFDRLREHRRLTSTGSRQVRLLKKSDFQLQDD